MPKVSMKKNISCMQVLKTLQVILDGNYSMQELIKILNKNEPVPIFNNSVVSKYINTCRFCGINIPKIHNKYFVTNMPFGFEFSSNEIDLLNVIQNVVRDEFSKKYNKIFNEFIEKLNRYSNKKLTRVEKDSFKYTIELFENAITDKRKIRLMYKTRVILDCIPVEISIHKGKTFFHVICNNKDKIIDAERISGLEVLNEKFSKSFNNQVVVFELKGPLALRYNLKENERLVKSYDGESITVSNHGENKEILFSRLLRYDDKCEIHNPKNYREEMKQIINNMLENYAADC